MYFLKLLKLIKWAQLILISVPINVILGQNAALEFRVEPYYVHSGFHNGDGISDEHRLAWSEIITIKNAPWLRVKFGNANLGRESFIRITSLQDESSQPLNSNTIAEWYNTSAFFNGDGVEIQLFVASTDVGVYIEIVEIYVGEHPVDSLQVETICDYYDDRSSSVNDATGRIVSVGCTGWIVSNGLHVSAGHCFNEDDANVLEFNVPPSLYNGTIQHPGPEDQYSINQQNVLEQDDGEGNDWVVFSVFNNSNTGLQPIDAQDSYFTIEQDLSLSQIRITGYGVDGDPPLYGNNGPRNEDSQTQQTHIGPNAGSTGTIMKYVTDTQPGNSGSPIINGSTPGISVGVHTDGGCIIPSGGYNSGTSNFHSGFWTALTTSLELCIMPQYWTFPGEGGDLFVELNSCGVIGGEFTVSIEENLDWLLTLESAMTGTSTTIWPTKNLTGQIRGGEVSFIHPRQYGASNKYLYVDQDLAMYLVLPGDENFIPENNHCYVTDEAYLSSDLLSSNIPSLWVTAGNQIMLLPGFRSGGNEFIANIQDFGSDNKPVMRVANQFVDKKSKVTKNNTSTLEVNNPENKLNKSQGTETKVEIPASYGLSQNYPNPFNPTTIIRYQLPVDSKVTIKLYDILGREVATLIDEFQDAGYKEVRFDASSLSSGVYIYNLIAGDYVSTMKMVVMK